MLSILKKLYVFLTSCRIVRVIATEIKYMVEGTRAVADDINLKKKNKCEIIDLSGKVAVVTGGARGIGSDIVKKLLICNVSVIIGCRNPKAGNETLSKIRKAGVTTGDCQVFQLDLASFASVKKFAFEVKNKTDKLHILVNNAGIMFAPFELTEDGFESQWQVNYLAPFLLTHLLYPVMYNTSQDSECRIINVSSCAHKITQHIDFNSQLNKSNFITGIAYADSKAAQISFTLWLSKLLKDKDVNISVFAVHPGIVDTDLFNGTPIKSLAPWLCKNVFKKLEDGATSVLYTCISPKLSGFSGLYLSNCRSIAPSKFTRDTKNQKQLFDYSLRKLDIEEFGEE